MSFFVRKSAAKIRLAAIVAENISGFILISTKARTTGKDILKATFAAWLAFILSTDQT